MEETTAGELADMLLECQLGVNQHAQVTHNGRQLNDIGPDRYVEVSARKLVAEDDNGFQAI